MPLGKQRAPHSRRYDEWEPPKIMRCAGLLCTLSSSSSTSRPEAPPSSDLTGFRHELLADPEGRIVKQSLPAPSRIGSAASWSAGFPAIIASKASQPLNARSTSRDVRWQFRFTSAFLSPNLSLLLRRAIQTAQSS